MERLYARLAPKGYNQIVRIDYKETFLLVVVHKSIRVLLAIACHYDCKIWHMDVKTAILNRKLDEAIDISQPKGFITEC